MNNQDLFITSLLGELEKDASLLDSAKKAAIGASWKGYNAAQGAVRKTQSAVQSVLPKPKSRGVLGSAAKTQVATTLSNTLKSGNHGTVDIGWGKPK